MNVTNNLQELICAIISNTLEQHPGLRSRALGHTGDAALVQRAIEGSVDAAYRLIESIDDVWKITHMYGRANRWTVVLSRIVRLEEKDAINFIEANTPEYDIHSSAALATTWVIAYLKARVEMSEQ
jgi:hypothetical protein